MTENPHATPSSADRFVKQAIEDILALKETRKSDPLRDACQRALSALDEGKGQNEQDLIDTVLAPFRIACEMRGPHLLPVALDCLGKLFIYPFLNVSHDKVNYRWELVILDIISASFQGPDKTDEKSQIQIVKALTNAVTGTNFENAVHGTHLLKCIRTAYNIFLLSKSANVQTLAQASLSQMLQTVFNRVIVTSLDDISTQSPRQNTNGSLNSPETISPPSRFKLSESLHAIESDNAFDCPPDCDRLESLEMRPPGVRASQDILTDSRSSRPSQASLSEQSFVDAYLVFRAICKLSMKAVGSDSPSDVKSQSIRSKLLALHLVHSILKTNISTLLLPAHCLFDISEGPISLMPNLFVHAVKQYLCLVVTRNVLSSIPGVFDAAIEIFGRMILGLRQPLKREIGIILTEILIPLLDSKSLSSQSQRLHFLQSLVKVFSDGEHAGRILVEIYLNYDCDSDAQDNIWEKLINVLSRIMTLQVEPLLETKGSSLHHHGTKLSSAAPQITTQGLSNFTKEQHKDSSRLGMNALELQRVTLDIIVKGVLRPLVVWYNQRVKFQDKAPVSESKEGYLPERPLSETDDNPAAFASAVQRKKRLAEAVRLFNYKPKKGIEFMLNNDLLLDGAPATIAEFLFTTDTLSKAMIGEYLGEGDEFNISIMHAFVDLIKFENMHFVEALRQFLQHFRLPGEAQKIDRFVLKFAERYLKGNPHSFSSADVAYVLAYSTIMLNTDQHNRQVKKRMTKDEFVKNNRGINNGDDLPLEMLEEIFDDIRQNEIILNDNVPELSVSSAPGSDISRKSKKESAEHSSQVVVSRTEAALISSHVSQISSSDVAEHVKITSDNTYHCATHSHHVGTMLQIVWMPILLCISTALQRTEDVDIMLLSLEGYRHAVFLCSSMELDFEKKAFLSNLCKFCITSDSSEAKLKAIESTKCLLEIAYLNGDAIDDFWGHVISCISQLEKLQAAALAQDNMLDTTSDRSEQDQRNVAFQALTVLIDKIFTSTPKMHATAIIHLVRALCEISWKEITSSVDKEHPRMYCLQKLLEVSYYNISRIRLEWCQIWNVMGPHLNQVGCHSNSNVGFFALDKLRQLACRFLEIEELGSFHFQSDFLSPIFRIFVHNANTKIRDMVLSCIKQFVQMRSCNLRSGWVVIFQILHLAVSDNDVYIVSVAAEIVKIILEDIHLASLTRNHFFPQLVKCLLLLSLNINSGKTSRQAIDSFNDLFQRIELIKSWHTVCVKIDMSELTMGAMVFSGEYPFASLHSKEARMPSKEDLVEEDSHACRTWVPIVYALQKIIFCDDLEIRSRALTSLFSGLKLQGHTFSQSMWAFCLREIIFSLFEDLNDDNKQMRRFSSDDDRTFWISTTMIQAIRDFVDLSAHHFSSLLFAVDSVLDLLILFLTQENESISSVGSTAILQFVEKNLSRLDEEVWQKILAKLVYVLNSTVPHSLMFDVPTDNSSIKPMKKPPQKSEFQSIILQCVLHLLVIQTIQEMFDLPELTAKTIDVMPKDTVLHLLEGLEQSYRFAKSFNSNLPLRKALFEMGFMKQLPNLLRQETSSAFTYSMLLFRVNGLTKFRDNVEQHLFPLVDDIFSTFNELDTETMKRNILYWRPVIVMILSRFSELPQNQFRSSAPKLYLKFVHLLSSDISVEMRLPLKSVLEVYATLFVAQDAE